MEQWHSASSALPLMTSSMAHSTQLWVPLLTLHVFISAQLRQILGTII